MARNRGEGFEFIQRTRRYIRLRWFLLLTITLPSLISLYLGSGLTEQRVVSLVISGTILLSNLVFEVLSRIKRSESYYKILAICLLVFDTLFITYFIYSKGGIESRSQILYVLPILLAVMLFGRLGVYLTAIGAAVGYDFVIIANFYGLIRSPEAVTNEATNGTYVINSIVFFTAILLITAVLADYLTRLMLQKEQQAHTTAIALKRAQAVAKVGSWEWDVVADTISWSDELYNIFGLPKGSLVDFEAFLKCIHPEDRQWTADLVRRSLKTRKPFSMDNRIVRPDKQVRTLHGEGKVVTDKHGVVTQLYGTAQDITDERALEAAKGDFVSLASHQLRTPASGVRMLLAMLRDGYIDILTPKQLSAVEQAYDANERLLRIADDLLNVAKLESGRLVLNKQRIDLGLWLRNVTAQQKLLAKEQHQSLRLVLPKTPVHLMADPDRLAMVVDNLLSNARKYTPARGRILVSLVPGKRQHKIVVSDTGSGMSRAEIAKLFTKFTRLDNPASRGVEGTGLGLYMAKSIVDLHGGTIRVRSKPNSGATFTVTLPISERA